MSRTSEAETTPKSDPTPTAEMQPASTAFFFVLHPISMADDGLADFDQGVGAHFDTAVVNLQGKGLLGAVVYRRADDADFEVTVVDREGNPTTHRGSRLTCAAWRDKDAFKNAGWGVDEAAKAVQADLAALSPDVVVLPPMSRGWTLPEDAILFLDTNVDPEQPILFPTGTPPAPAMRADSGIM